jgi:hypothetical protein
MRLRELKQHIKDIRSGWPRNKVFALHDRERREVVELASSLARGGIGR